MSRPALTPEPTRRHASGRSKPAKSPEESWMAENPLSPDSPFIPSTPAVRRVFHESEALSIPAVKSFKGPARRGIHHDSSLSHLGFNEF